jgi:hypothetical protein
MISFDWGVCARYEAILCFYVDRRSPEHAKSLGASPRRGHLSESMPGARLSISPMTGSVTTDTAAAAPSSGRSACQALWIMTDSMSSRPRARRPMPTMRIPHQMRDGVILPAGSDDQRSGRAAGGGAGGRSDVQ